MAECDFDLMLDIDANNNEFKQKRNVLLTDGLLGNIQIPDVKVIVNKISTIEDVEKMVTIELDCEPSELLQVFIVAIGSFNAAASFIGLDETSDKNYMECKRLEMLEKVEERLNKLKVICQTRDCRIILCSLIPLPGEQDSDSLMLHGYNRELTTILSKLYVEINKSIDEYNKELGVKTPAIHKFFINRYRYQASNQRKIRLSCYRSAAVPKDEVIVEVGKYLEKYLSYLKI